MPSDSPILPGPAQEIDPKMQLALQHRLPPETHVFRNIMDVFVDGETWHKKFMEAPSFDDQIHLLYNVAPRCPTAFCVTHGQHCPLQTHGSARVGGTPCQDFSLAGKRKGLKGPQLPHLLAFGAKSDYLQTPVVGLECVKGLPTSVVADAFGDSYAWPLQVHLQPADTGFTCINRTRQGSSPAFCKTLTKFAILKTKDVNVCKKVSF